jgi:oligopeptide/dipeptide ABC transporter ATP-binding protein
VELLEIAGLTTSFATPSGTLTAVDDLDLTVRQGRVLGLVGESGCGKTITALSILKLVPPPGKITAGRILFEGIDLLALPEEQLRAVRGAKISMVFQEPMTALNPVFTVGNQISEVLTTHFPLGKNEAMDRSIDLLRSVGIPSPEKRVHEYPHQLSGGMRQRVMIAMAIACRPSLVLADEPTTALDVTIQAHILELLTRLQQEMGMALMLVTHDLGLIAERAHEVAVMYAGKIVEQADTLELFRQPLHPYTRGLMASLPAPGGTKRSKLKTIPGTVPRLSELPAGCRFAPRCELRGGVCDQMPELVEISPGHKVRCWKAK